MSGVNQVIIIGNLGRNPEIRSMQDGKKVASFSLATSESWKDKKSGERKEKTEWHRVTAFDPLATIIEAYAVKGSQLYVSGKLQTRKWTDQSGVEKYTTEIIAQNIQLLGGKADKPEGMYDPEPSQANYDDEIPF